MGATRRHRSATVLQSAWQRVVGMPRGGRLLGVALIIAAGFVAVVLPLFSGGGAPQAEIAGFVPTTVAAGSQVRVDLAVDNVGDSIISPLCVAVSGDGARLVSADFQGLDHVAAVGNRVCGGQLTAQETISLTVVLVITRRGSTDVRLVPQQGATVIGPVFSTTVTAS